MKDIKTAFVTGASGFIGRYMVMKLERLGIQVWTCDIKNREDLLSILPQVDTKFDLVVHLACQVGGRQDINGMPMNLATNVQLDGALFQWALRTKQKRVLYFSGSAVYPLKYQTPSRWGSGEMMMAYGAMGAGTPDPEHGSGRGYILLNENLVNHDYGTHEPDANYGWAKLTGERMAQAAIASGLRVYIVRPFSGYASDQSLDYPFPSLIQRARDKKDPFDIWGSKRQVRDWIHVTDVVSGSLAVVEEDVSHPVNLCTGEGTSMEGIANLACSIMGYQPEINELKGMPTGVFSSVGDPESLHEIYTPMITIEQGIGEALHWVPNQSGRKPIGL